MDRFWKKVDASGDCWLWTAGKVTGYGQFWYQGRNVYAHRFAYESLVGPIRSQMTLDHLCRVRACVNPDHLQVVSQRTNTLRSPIAPAAVNARKTHCPKGHRLTGGNVYLYQGQRRCRPCGRDAQRRWKARQ